MKCEFNIGDYIRIKDDCIVAFRDIDKNITYKVIGCFGNMVQIDVESIYTKDKTYSYYSSFFELDKQYSRELKLNKILKWK